MAGLDREYLDGIISMLQEYAEKYLTLDFLLEMDHKDEFPDRVLEALYNPNGLAIHSVFIPEEYDGIGGSAYDIYRISEVLASIDVGIATGVFATFLGADPIVVGGTDEQKKRWMGRIANDSILCAYGATEPQAGSDLALLSTKAVPFEKDGKKWYKLTGRKQWISNGGKAKLWTILANAPGGPSWFVVEEFDEPVKGFEKAKPEDKLGIRLSNTVALFLDEVEVPEENLVGGKEGQGLAQAQAVFGYTRLMIGAFGLGAGWEAVKRVIPYSQARVQGGAPLSQKQAYTHKLVVPNAVRLEAARSYIEWVAEGLDAGGGHALATEGAVAKYMATESGNKAADDAIQGMGGYGYTKEYAVEKIKRDVRITQIYEGTSEIMEWTIARDRWQLHLKTKGAYYQDWAKRCDEIHKAEPKNGANYAALAFRALGVILERCRLDRLTRNQHVLFRLGKMIAFAETAAIFAERVVKNPTEAISLDVDTRQAMSRIHGRDAALLVATDGLQWSIGAGQTDPNLANSLGLPAIYHAQAGMVADMDFVAKKLNEAFPANIQQ